MRRFLFLALAVVGSMAFAEPSLAVHTVATPQDYVAYMKQVRTAIGQGTLERAMDLIADWGKVPGITRVSPDQLLPWLEDITAFQHARYAEVFEPPANAASFFLPGLMSWKSFNFSGGAFGPMAGDDTSTRYGPAPGYLVITRNETPLVRVDLDRDGTPEITFDGVELVATRELAVTHDRAGDGRRQQWLVAGAGERPRENARVWIYRDGRTLSVFVRAGNAYAKRFGVGMVLPETGGS